MGAQNEELAPISAAQEKLAWELGDELAEAVAKDETIEEGGCDVSASLLGLHTSNWLRGLAVKLLKAEHG